MLGARASQTQAQEPRSLSLREAVASALSLGPLARVAAADASLARAQATGALGDLLPSISASASAQHNVEVPQAFLPARLFDPDSGSEDLLPVRFGADNVWQAGLTVSVPLLDLSRTARWRAARYQEEVAQAVHQGDRAALVAEVRRRYLSALLAEAEHALLLRSRERLVRALDQSQAFQRAGIGSAYEVARLQAQLASLDPDIHERASAAASAIRRVVVLTGLQVGGPVVLQGDLITLGPDTALVVGDPNRALLDEVGLAQAIAIAASFAPAAIAQTPAAQASRARVSATATSRRAALRDFLPRLEAFGYVGLTAQENGKLDFFGERPSQRTQALYGGIRVEWTGLAVWSRKAAHDEQTAAWNADMARDAALQADLVVEADSLIRALGDSRARLGGRRQAAAVARQGYDIALAERRAGLGTELQLADADLALRQAEVGYARAVFDYLSAGVGILSLVGTFP